MTSLESRVEKIQSRRRAAVVAANERLLEITGPLGIRAKLETQTPTVGISAFIPHATGNAIVPVSHLEDLAERINELETALEGHARVERNLLEGK